MFPVLIWVSCLPRFVTLQYESVVLCLKMGLCFLSGCDLLDQKSEEEGAFVNLTG